MAVDFFALGQRIQSKRKSMKKTQEDLAENLSVSVGYVSQIERGITKVSLDTLAEITECLNCTVSELLDGVVPKSSSYLSDDLEKTILNLSPQNKRILFEIAKILKREQPPIKTKSAFMG